MTFILLQLLSSAESDIPIYPDGGYLHFQTFSDKDWNKNWKISESSNYSGPWEVRDSDEPKAIPDEKLLLITEPSKYYAISHPFGEAISIHDKTLVLQYEVRLQETLECGGAYMKLFSSENYDPKQLTNETKYSIMFGPDKCGSTNKVHFIFRHKNPITGEIEEKHMTQPPSIKTDKASHLYTLIVRPDNTFEVLIDGESTKKGNLLLDFQPSVNPPKMIDDPEDKKPEDWVDHEMMPDPEASKPEDWDETLPEFISDPNKLEMPSGWLENEPLEIPDPDAKKPEEWDDDIHGEWAAQLIPNPKCESSPGCGPYEPPTIRNPEYKGKWKAPLIKNPEYKGPWKAKQIPNPQYYEDMHPHNFLDIAGLGFELWEVNKNIGFNNIWFGNDEAAVHEWNKVHFLPKHKQQETEIKKTEPSKSGDFLQNLKTIGTTLKDAFLQLYNDNPMLTIICLSSVFVVLILIIILCRRSTPTAQDPVKKTIQPKDLHRDTVDNKDSENKKNDDHPAEDSSDENEEANPKDCEPEIAVPTTPKQTPEPETKPEQRNKASPNNKNKRQPKNQRRIDNF